MGITALCAGVTAALAVGACGGVSASIPRGKPLEIAVTEYKLRPNQITVPGGTVTITVRNDGRLTHNLDIVPRTGTTPSADHTPAIPPGQSATITVALKPGRYTIASTILSDQSLGATGTLTVR